MCGVWLTDFTTLFMLPCLGCPHHSQKISMTWLKWTVTLVLLLKYCTLWPIHSIVTFFFFLCNKFFFLSPSVILFVCYCCSFSPLGFTVRNAVLLLSSTPSQVALVGFVTLQCMWLPWNCMLLTFLFGVFFSKPL